MNLSNHNFCDFTQWIHRELCAARQCISLNRWHGQVMKFDEKDTHTHNHNQTIDNVLQYMQIQYSQSRTFGKLRNHLEP